MFGLTGIRKSENLNLDAAKAIRLALHPLSGAAADFDPLLEMIGDARFVLLGEASHGTAEFYEARADITMRLVTEKGFNAVAVEADWPDAHRINCYLRARGSDTTADDALSDFQRFPLWMWRNTTIKEFIGRLRAHNEALPNSALKVGFYGLDLYSLHSSVNAVLSYLHKVDPTAAAQARERYSCFENYGREPQLYGQAVAFEIAPSCEDEVVQQLIELRHRAYDYARRDGRLAEDDFFNAEMNARVVQNAEQYYRSMFRGRNSTWNLRDTHMADTLDALVAHLEKQGLPGKVAVWAHNSHLGDAGATQMGEDGELNLGQLTRQRHSRDTVLIGFSTYTGTVTAATNWDEPAQRKNVRPGLPGSVEELMHHAGAPRFLLNLRDSAIRDTIPPRLLERAIGVIYRPQTERHSHYFFTRLASQFDALLHFDETTALEPLDLTPGWEQGEFPDTYPSGL
jgi:erythromycin esterase-like protein